ncbi:MAG: hypothetical protein WBH52_05095 [Pseudomonas aeruginosa]
MRLYHGTTSLHLTSVLNDGLKPRGENPSLWAAASNAGLVYLTTAYELHFAGHATSKDHTGDVMLIELDSEKFPERHELLADEDAIVGAIQLGAMHFPDFAEYDYNLNSHELAQLVASDLDKWSKIGADAQWSLNVIGNCTYKGIIPPSAITRIVTYDAKTEWWIGFHDPLISIQNFRFVGAEIAQAQLVLFDRMEEAQAVTTFFPNVYSLSELHDFVQKYRTGMWDRVDGELVKVFG